MRQGRNWIVLLIALMTAMLAAPGAIAEESTAVPFSASVTISGTVPKTADTFKLTMSALDGAPMPAEAVDGSVSRTVTGAGTVNFGEVKYLYKGVYRYQIRQEALTNNPSATSYDQRVYTVEVFNTYENTAPSVVIFSAEGEKTAEVVFINSYAEISITATKVWEDSNNQDGKRDTVTLILSGSVIQDGQRKLVQVKNPEKEISLDADDLSVTWDELPEYQNGNRITYSVSEQGTIQRNNRDVIVLNGADYTVTVTGSAAEGFTVTNTHIPETVDVSVRKIWDDNDNQDGKRPESLTVTLSNGDSVTLNAENHWQATISGLPKYSSGQVIAYTWTENLETDEYYPNGTAVNGYSTILTNTHDTEYTSATVRKIWDDADNQDGIRPESLTVTLSDGQSVTLNEENQWTATITGLEKYAGGREINYTWTEETVEGYTLTKTEKDGLITSLTNYHKPEEISLRIQKVWVDGENRQNTRPGSLTVTLSDGQTATLNEASNWEAEITGLPKYEAGQEIVYSWNEGTIPLYELISTTTENELTTLTNRLTDQTSISGTKTWIDGGRAHDNEQEIRLTLTRTSAKEGSKQETVQAVPGWNGNTYTYSGLDVYDDEGYAYSYSVSEAQVSGYDVPEQSGNRFTNRIHDPEDVTVSGTKTWIDGGRTHDNAAEIVLTLRRTANGLTTTVEATPDWEGNTYTFSGLDRYDENGYSYSYSVTETQVSGYDAPEQSGNNITNRIHDPKNVTVSGTKTWVDGGRTHDNAQEIELTLTRISAKEGSEPETVDAVPGWNGNSYTYRGLDAYDDEGYAYSYSVSEAQVSGYDAPEQSGNSFTNRIHDPEDVTLSGTKTWVDGGRTHDNAAEIILTLRRTANGITATVNTAPDWEGNTYTFSGLDRYDENGYPYTYSVTEMRVSGYDAPEQSGNHFTNRISDLKNVTVSGTKTWVDGGRTHDNAQEIELTLTRISAKEGSEPETVAAAPSWKDNTYVYSGLDAYDDEGYAYSYSVSETQVSGYDAPEQSGNSFTNRIHDPEDVTVSGTKTWIDGGRMHDNAAEITLTLRRTANGLTTTVEAAPDWEGNTYTFSGLDRYDENGYPYTYSVTEAQVNGYDAPVQNDYNFTNRIHDDMNVSVTVTKVWDDDSNRDGARPANITVQLLRNGTEHLTAEINGTGDTWTYSFTGLPRYNDDGSENVYTVTETPVDGYTTYIDNGTFTITNTHEIATTSRTVVKAWDDDNNATEARPESLAVTLMANGAPARNAAGVTIQVTLSEANGWAATVTDLPAYENGREITYRWLEAAVPRYRLTNDIRVPTAAGETTTLTNTRVPTYNLTVHYLYLDTGETAAPSVEETHDEGDVYDVVSPTLDNGYVTVRLRVQGVMPDRDMVEYVYYYRPDVIISDFETPLGLGQVFINIGDCIE